MRAASTLTAAIATFSGIAASQAAPITYNLTFNDIALGPSSGTGFFTIDDSLLVPNQGYSDPTLVSDFSATFTNVPGYGTVSFDETDLNALNLKTGPTGALSTVSFGTDDSANPNLDAFIFDSTFLVDSSGLSIEYETVATAVPEPSSLALLAAGAAGVPLLRRRRAQRG